MVKQINILTLLSSVLFVGGGTVFSALTTSCSTSGPKKKPMQLRWEALEAGDQIVSIDFVGFEDSFHTFTYSNTIDQSEAIEFEKSQIQILTLYSSAEFSGQVLIDFPGARTMLSFENSTQIYHDAWTEDNFSWNEHTLLNLKKPMTISSVVKCIDPTLKGFFQTANFNCLV